MFAVVGLCVGSALCHRSGKDGSQGTFATYVAPGTISKSASCTWVTIHTDLSFSIVKVVSAQVNGVNVRVAWTFADDRGNLVVKLRYQDVVAVVAPPSATIALRVTTVDDRNLESVSTVRVKR